MEFTNPPTPPIAEELEVQGGCHCLSGLQVGTTAKGDAITRKQDYRGTIPPNGADNQRDKYRNTTSSNVLCMLPQGGELSMEQEGDRYTLHSRISRRGEAMMVPEVAVVGVRARSSDGSRFVAIGAGCSVAPNS
ncbi:hypothetical protein R1flu_001094 [Riccia fluitans]|uniref:Uncharacterized protein n=1 Tax=Riccia fluitans TaxID=41844 RepID=A0ABD1Y3A6_9MARC